MSEGTRPEASTGPEGVPRRRYWAACSSSTASSSGSSPASSLGGRLSGLATVRFRLGGLAIVALAIQVVLFSSLADDLDADVRRAIYVGSTALVGVVVLANLRLTGRAARSPSGRR